MKNKIIFTAMLLSVLCFGGCDKHHDTKPASPKCKISQISVGGTTYQITYNAAGKVNTILSGNGYVWNYTYSGSTIVVTVTHNGSFQYKTTSHLNAAGLPVNSVSEFDNTSTRWSKDNFEYDGNLLKKLTRTTSDGGNYVYTCTNDGTNITQSNGGINGQTTFTYYTDKKNQPGGFINYFNLTNIVNPFVSHNWGMAFSGFDNRNLLKSVFNDGMMTTFSYNFDANGKITSMTIATGSQQVVQYQYNCK